MQRFSRTELLLGKQAFSRLAGSHVAVIGLGAVGGYAVEGLARSGLGRLSLVDFDVIQTSNINRQIFALESTIGQAKADAAARRVRDINPDCRVEALNLFVDDDSVESIFATGPDIIIDAIDSLNPKVRLICAAHRRKIGILSSMGAALRTDPTRIRIGDLSETRGCPLARRIRKRLKREGIVSGITCVYSTEPVDFAYPSTTTDEPAPVGAADRGRERNTLGSLPTLTAIFGLVLANEAIKKLCAKP